MAQVSFPPPGGQNPLDIILAATDPKDLKTKINELGKKGIREINILLTDMTGEKERMAAPKHINKLNNLLFTSLQPLEDEEKGKSWFSRDSNVIKIAENVRKTIEALSQTLEQPIEDEETVHAYCEYLIDKAKMMKPSQEFYIIRNAITQPTGKVLYYHEKNIETGKMEVKKMRIDQNIDGEWEMLEKKGSSFRLLTFSTLEELIKFVLPKGKPTPAPQIMSYSDYLEIAKK